MRKKCRFSGFILLVEMADFNQFLKIFNLFGRFTMNGYTKKVITTALFSLLFSGTGNYVNSMECIEIEKKISEQVSVKSTIDLVNKFEKLNDASDYFKKTFPENWKNYLDLYNKCFKKISNKKADYIKNIEEFEKMHNSGVRNSGSLVEYEKVLTENIEYVDKMVKELFKKIDEKYGKLPKTGFFASLFTKPDDRTLLVNYVNKLSEDHRKTKREIAEKVGILTKKSINRNILQASNNSPLKKLEQLYNALQQSSGEFTFEKNLLEIPKAFDIKVENSLQKVVDCKWKNIDELIQITNFNLDDKFKIVLNGMLDISKDAIKDVIASMKFNGLNSPFSLKSLVEIVSLVQINIENLTPKNKSFCGLTRLYTRILGYSEQCRFLLKYEWR